MTLTSADLAIISAAGVPSDLTVYEVFPGSVNDPDKDPTAPPAQGMWVWWRTGPHPQGMWLAMDATTSAWSHAYSENKKKHPVWQDQAHGDSGDWGNFSCHACGYFSDGYPEPDHTTECDGVCKYPDCSKHYPSRITVHVTVPLPSLKPGDRVTQTLSNGWVTVSRRERAPWSTP